MPTDPNYARTAPPWSSMFYGQARRAVPPDQMRVSDAERQEMADALGKHFADGRLDRSEFDERVHRAMSAKTRMDFAGLTDDLPPSGTPAAGPAVAPAAARAWLLRPRGGGGADHRGHVHRSLVARAVAVDLHPGVPHHPGSPAGLVPPPPPPQLRAAAAALPASTAGLRLRPGPLRSRPLRPRTGNRPRWDGHGLTTPALAAGAGAPPAGGAGIGGDARAVRRMCPARACRAHRPASPGPPGRAVRRI